MNDVCGECGRPYTNWESTHSRRLNKQGNKTLQAGPIDRLTNYRQWRMTWNTHYVNDVPDQVEYRLDGQPASFLELTQCRIGDGYNSVPRGYLDAVWTRLTKRDRTQYNSLKLFADTFRRPAFMVVFESTLDNFYLREVDGDEWMKLPRQQYKTFISNLGREP